MPKNYDTGLEQGHPRSRKLKAGWLGRLTAGNPVSQMEEPDSITLSEILEKKYPKANTLIWGDLGDAALRKTYKISSGEMSSLQQQLLGNSFPFDWESKHHGTQSFSTIDEVGGFFESVVYAARR